MAFISFFPAGGRGWWWRWGEADTAGLVADLVTFCVLCLGCAGAFASSPSFSCPLFSGERTARGDRDAFLFARIPAFRQASSSLSPRVKTPGPVPRVLSLCLVYYSCLSSRLFQFACHLHTFHFSFLTPAEGQGGGERGEGRGGRSVTFLSKRCRSRNVEIGVGAVERWSREESAAPPLLSSREPGVGQGEEGGTRRLRGSSGRGIGARAPREDGQIAVRVGVGDVLGQRIREAKALAVIAGSLWCWAASILSFLGGTYSFAPVRRTGEGGKER